MTLEQLQQIIPSATAETWYQHPNGGGWVHNLSTVAATAYVGSNAQVYGNAQVYDNAQVCGNALVCGNARVYDDALVYGNAQATPLVITGATQYTINWAGGNLYRCGCRVMPYAHWFVRYSDGPPTNSSLSADECKRLLSAIKWLRENQEGVELDEQASEVPA